jgi:hypothetical protein
LAAELADIEALIAESRALAETTKQEAAYDPFVAEEAAADQTLAAPPTLPKGALAGDQPADSAQQRWRPTLGPTASATPARPPISGPMPVIPPLPMPAADVTESLAPVKISAGEAVSVAAGFGDDPGSMADSSPITHEYEETSADSEDSGGFGVQPPSFDQVLEEQPTTKTGKTSRSSRALGLILILIAAVALGLVILMQTGVVHFGFAACHLSPTWEAWHST